MDLGEAEGHGEVLGHVLGLQPLALEQGDVHYPDPCGVDARLPAAHTGILGDVRPHRFRCRGHDRGHSTPGASWTRPCGSAGMPDVVQVVAPAHEGPPLLRHVVLRPRLSVGFMRGVSAACIQFLREDLTDAGANKLFTDPELPGDIGAALGLLLELDWVFSTRAESDGLRHRLRRPAQLLGRLRGQGAPSEAVRAGRAELCRRLAVQPGRDGSVRASAAQGPSAACAVPRGPCQRAGQEVLEGDPGLSIEPRLPHGRSSVSILDPEGGGTTPASRPSPAWLSIRSKRGSPLRRSRTARPVASPGVPEPSARPPTPRRAPGL